MHSIRLAIATLILAVSALIGLPQTVTADNPADFSAITGAWFRHGVSMTIGPDGQAVANWRVYQWCNDLTRPAPCDSIIGNNIIDGGLAMLRFTSGNSGTATATVLMSSQSTVLAPGAQVSLLLLPGGVAQVSGLGGGSTLICGPNFDPSQFQNLPCGA